MAQEIDITYWIVGTDPTNTNTVTIGIERETTRTLKDKIKYETGWFDRDDEIDIWKVPCVIKLHETDKRLDFPLDITQICPASKINNIFPDPLPDDHLHLIVRSRVFDINCHIQNVRSINIKIHCGETVFALQKAIKAEVPELETTGFNMLSLWKFSAPKDDDFEQKVRNLKGEDQLEAFDRLWKVFLRPRELNPNHVHIVLKLRDAEFGVKRPLPDGPDNITGDILSRWTKKQILTVPSLSELPTLLDRPLSEREKIPLTPSQFNSLISGLMEVRDFCGKTHVEQLFRVSETERSEGLFLLFCRAIIRSPPPEDGSDRSYISFWDENVRSILELLIPRGRSIRDDFDTPKLMPDYGFILNHICPIRGEEEAPEYNDNPKAALVDKLTWTYSPAPYLFSYYATGPDLTLAAICAPQPPSQTPYVQDLAYANLRFRRERIANLQRLINLVSYIEPLLKIIGHRECPEFTLLQSDSKIVQVGLNSVKKTYIGPDSMEQIEYIQDIYRQLAEKHVPYVDALAHVNALDIYVKPKGIPVKPSNEKELLEAVTCVLETLTVLHQPPEIFHRDIRWPNILRHPINASEWFLTDWDDAVGSVNTAAKRFCEKEHSPRVFVDNHGGEVDVWGVGNLIAKAPGFGCKISHELLALGERMKDDEALSAQDALTAVKAYQENNTS